MWLSGKTNIFSKEDNQAHSRLVYSNYFYTGWTKPFNLRAPAHYLDAANNTFRSHFLTHYVNDCEQE